MNRIYTFFICCMIALLATACSKENDLTPSGENEDYFTVSPDAADIVSVTRREFHDRNGVHLLFTDTLRHEQRGTYNDGTPFWFTEMIDLGYAVTGSSTTIYRLDYLTDQTAREAAAAFIETRVLPHLTNDFRPYSVLLLDQLYTYNSSRKTWILVNFCDNFRCLVISTGAVIGYTEEEQKAFCQAMFLSIATSKISGLSTSELSEFYAFCEDYYGYDYDECDLPAGMDADNITQEDLYTLGFLNKVSYYFSYATSDRDSYVKAIFNTGEEEFRATYAAYPVILLKYDIMKQIIRDMGFKF